MKLFIHSQTSMVPFLLAITDSVICFFDHIPFIKIMSFHVGWFTGPWEMWQWFHNIISQLLLWIESWPLAVKFLSFTPHNPILKSTLVQIMAWCHQATSHYLSQCWPRSMLPYGMTRPQCVNCWQTSGQFTYINKVPYLAATMVSVTGTD